MKTTPAFTRHLRFALLAAIGLAMAACAGNFAPPDRQSAYLTPGQTGCPHDQSATNCYDLDDYHATPGVGN